MNSGRSLRSARMFGDELQASAAGRLRPAAPLRAPIQNSIFKIHCGLPITARRATSARLFVFGPQPAKGARDCKELRAFAAGGCGPPIAARSISCKKPAAERWACTSEPPGRELQPPPRGRLRAADVSDVAFASKPFSYRPAGAAAAGGPASRYSAWIWSSSGKGLNPSP